MQPLSVKIIGSGNAAANHRKALKELPDLFQEVNSEKPDVVNICSINEAHFAQTCWALKNGSHVIVEKPVCGSLAQCDVLKTWEETTGKTIFPIFQYRFADHDPVQGPLIVNWRRDSQYYASWRNYWHLAFGGTLTMHAIHIIDLVLREHGQPLLLWARMDTQRGVERYAALKMGTPGKMVSIQSFVHTDIEQGGFGLGDAHAGYVEQFRRIHTALTAPATDAAGPATLAEARQVIEVLTAAYWSAYTNEPVTLPILPSHPFYNRWYPAFAEQNEQV